MPSFLQLFAVAAIATSSLAAPQANVAATTCANPQVASNRTLHLAGKDLVFTSYTCAATSQAVAKRGLIDGLLCILLGIDCPPAPAPAPTPAPAPRNVCGASCTLSCNNVTGRLPPISDDCAQIQDSIQIFQSEQQDSFVVDPNHMESLSFGTCSMFFENFSDKQLQSCWSSLSIQGGQAGDNCFPPNQPFFPEGLCTGNDGTWAIGATHS